MMDRNNVNTYTRNRAPSSSSAVGSVNRTVRRTNLMQVRSWPVNLGSEPNNTSWPYYSAVSHTLSYCRNIGVIDNRTNNVTDNSNHNYGGVATVDNRTIIIMTSKADEVLAPDDSVQQWQLPSPTNIFTGRERELEEMRQYFGIETSPGECTPNYERKVFVVYGLGGSGKTQLVLKFAQTYGSWFRKIFYVDASNTDMIEAHLASMARHFKAGETAKDALTRVLAPPRNWLLIFDNADDPELNLREYFPSGNHGCIIITTRNKDYTTFALQSNIHLADLPSEDAVKLLLKATMLKAPYNDTTLPSANLLARKLCYLPLAITQAGAYVRKNSTIEEYLQLFRKRRKKILKNRNDNIHDQSRPVYATWDISYQRLDDSAKDFLYLCAFLHRREIPKTIFQNGIPRLGTGKINVSQESRQKQGWNSILRGHWTSNDEWDIDKFNHTITQLTSYSFIVVSDRHGILLYSLHELVQCWVRDSLDIEKSMAIRTTLHKLFCRSIDHGTSLLAFLNRRLLLPHAVTISPDALLQDSEIGPADILGVAKIYDESGRWPVAKKLYAQAVRIMKRTMGKEHPDTLLSMGSLAAMYRKQGEWAEAKELQVEVLETSRREFGNDHLHTLSAMNNLATTFTDEGRLVEAEKLQVEVLETRKMILGENNPDTLIAMNNLASIYRGQGRLAEAEKFQIEALKSFKKELGKDHPDTLSVMNNLAVTYGDQRLWVKAEKLQIEALESFRRVFGKDHPDTLSVIKNLAITYTNQGRLAEAENLYIGALENRIGRDYPYTLSAIHCLAKTFSKQEQFSKHDKLYTKVLDALKGILGREHPYTLITMGHLAIEYGKQARWAECEALYTELLELHQRTLGEEHPETLLTMQKLAATYSNQRQWTKAEELLTKVQETRKRIPGNDQLGMLTAIKSLEIVRRKRLAERKFKISCLILVLVLPQLSLVTIQYLSLWIENFRHQ